MLVGLLIEVTPSLVSRVLADQKGVICVNHGSDTLIHWNNIALAYIPEYEFFVIWPIALSILDLLVRSQVRDSQQPPSSYTALCGEDIK